MYILLLIIVFLILAKYDLKYIILSSILILIFIKLFINQSSNNYSNELISELSKYKNKNIIEYKYGINSWKKFINIINNVENTEYPNYNFEKAQEIFDNCIKNFRALYLLNNDNDIKVLVDELYNKGYILLQKKSKILNNMWENNPNIFSKQIILNNPIPHNVSFI
tara:strand:+ start:408 stop:905 length:498 start_codon:yes stop_codon:yes gene_type:complete